MRLERSNYFLGSACGSGRRWNHLNDVHHAQVLVPENVAVKDESANVISAEVDAEPDTGIGMGGVVPDASQLQLKYILLT